MDLFEISDWIYCLHWWRPWQSNNIPQTSNLLSAQWQVLLWLPDLIPAASLVHTYPRRDGIHIQWKAIESQVSASADMIISTNASALKIFRASLSRILDTHLVPSIATRLWLGIPCTLRTLAIAQDLRTLRYNLAKPNQGHELLVRF